jgi:hypothetical protein
MFRKDYSLFSSIINAGSRWIKDSSKKYFILAHTRPWERSSGVEGLKLMLLKISFWCTPVSGKEVVGWKA